MDTSAIIDFLKEITFLLVVFGAFLVLAMAKGKQTLINAIMALYLGLLLSLRFPYYESMIAGVGPGAESMIRISVFVFFTIISFWLFARLMPREFDEKAFQGFGIKMLFAFAASALVISFSYNVLPITEFITPGSPIQTLFAPKEYFFWWLLTPIVILFWL